MRLFKFNKCATDKLKLRVKSCRHKLSYNCDSLYFVLPLQYTELMFNGSHQRISPKNIKKLEDKWQKISFFDIHT